MKRHRLVQDSSVSRLSGRAKWAMLGELLQVLSSGVLFFILARLLTTKEEFGVLGAVIGIARPVGSLFSLGATTLLVKRVSQGVDRQQAWGDATAIGILGPLIGAALAIAARPLILPSVPPLVFALLLVGQLSFLYLTELAVMFAVGLRQLRFMVIIRAIVAVSRFSFLIAFAVFAQHTIAVWAWFSFGSFVVAAVSVIWFMNRVFGVWLTPRWLKKADVREGLPFAFNGTTEGLLDASDRPMLLSYGRGEDAGLYTVGGRLVQLTYLPLISVMRAGDADVFQAGAKGVRSALRATKKLFPPVVGLGCLASAGLWVFGPAIPLLLGEKWEDTILIARWLSFLPPLRALQYLLGNVLNATGLQTQRMYMTLVSAVTNVGLNLWFLRSGGWRTAVITTMVGEALLTLLFGLYLWRNQDFVADEPDLAPSALAKE